VDVDMFNGTQADLDALAAPPNTPPRGWLDGVSCDSIGGWAQDQDAPDQPIDVHLYFDATPGEPNAKAFAVHANQKRDDLCQAIGSCNHGFSASPPRSLMDGMAHPVWAFGIDTAGGTNPMLSGSPKTLQCDPPALPLDPLHGVKRRISSPDVFGAWRFDLLRDLATEPDAVVSALAEGSDLEAMPNVVQADDGSPEVWLLDLGMRRHVIDPDSLAAWRFDGMGAIVSKAAKEVYALPIGPDLPSAPFVFKASEDPKVYLLDVSLSSSAQGGAGGSSATTSGAGGAGGGSAPSDSMDQGSSCSVGRASEPRREAAFVLLGLAMVLAKRLRRR
jgi:MYXO-CTERM domain-containing protein